jgi:hypothetical protein
MAAVPSPGVKGRIEAPYRRPSKRRRNTMSNKPTHIAYVVIQSDQDSNQKPFWHEVGAVWPHKNGSGFDLMIPAGISVTGRIVCVERKDKPAKGDQPT